jgi:putative transposase
VTRTNALEALVIAGWVRGLSDRDIEAALAEVLGRAGSAVPLECEPDLLGHQG